jgi:hexosaminidase
MQEALGAGTMLARFVGNRERMTNRFLWMVLPVVLALGTTAMGERANDSDALNLRPRPKEVTLHERGFRVRHDTRIVVQFGHQSEDRIAAETLAEEIADESGLNLNIVGTKDSAKARGGAIVLARLEDRRVRRFLAAKGLTADEAVGDQGYLLFSDKSHLIVAARTGEGLFYGVQTLRQLLRPAGKHLVCPRVGIRDWPNLELHDAGQNVSRESVPESLKMFRRPKD